MLITMNPVKPIVIEDIPVLNEMLKSENLPQIEPKEFASNYFKYVGTNGSLQGSIGLEIYGNYGLLRSMVVDKNYRNQGIAHLLVSRILEESKKLRLKEIYLLTTTADKYFAQKGFSYMDRTETPAEIKQSKEYSSQCPSSSTLMKMSIL
jgi:amino-acid N-acetyltransferase